jgi:hypothetical protein
LRNNFYTPLNPQTSLMITESELIRLSQEKFEKWEKSDLDSISNLFDDQGVLICSNGKPETKSEILEIVKSGSMALKNLHLQRAFARVYGNTGVVHGEGEITYAVKGEEHSGGLHFLDVWVEREGGWKLVSSHFNEPH